MSLKTSPPSRAYGFGYGLLLALACFLVLLAFLQFSQVNRNPGALFPDMLAGTAERPYVARVLTPCIIRTVSQLLKGFLDEGAVARAIQPLPGGSWFQARFNIGESQTIEGLVAAWILFGMLVIFARAFRGLWTALFSTSVRVRDIWTLLSLAFLLPFFGFGYVYDFTTLALAALAFLFLARHQYGRYLAVFLLFCWHKETAVLWIAVFWFWYPRNFGFRKSFWMFLVLQIAVFAVIRLYVLNLFSANPGSLLFGTWAVHWTTYQENPLGALALFGALAFILWTVLFDFRKKPVFLYHAGIIGLPLLGLYFLFGWPFEIRVFYEVYPIVVLFAAYAVMNLLRMPVIPAAADPRSRRDSQAV